MGARRQLHGIRARTARRALGVDRAGRVGIADGLAQGAARATVGECIDDDGGGMRALQHQPQQGEQQQHRETTAHDRRHRPQHAAHDR